MASAVALITACGGGDVAEGLAGAIVNLVRLELAAVAFSGDRFVTVGKFGIRVSDDGALFRTLPNTGLFSLAVAHGSSGWVAADIDGLFTSQDGSAWTKMPSPAPGTIYAAAFGRERYVLVGAGGAIFVSEDARSWNGVPSPTAEDLLGVAFVGDGFLAVGRGGAAIAASDGASWSPVALPTSVDLRGIASNDDAIVVTGHHGTILRSTDGRSWDFAPTGIDEDLTAATFGDGRVIVVGRSGTIMLSDDAAVTFRSVAVDFGETRDGVPHLYGVAFGNGRFAAVGETIVVSSDGSSWTQATFQQDPEPQPSPAPGSDE